MDPSNFSFFPGFVFAPDFASRRLKKLNELIFSDEILLEDPKLDLKSVEEDPRAPRECSIKSKTRFKCRFSHYGKL